MNKEMKKYFPEITIARGIGIVLVVIGHAFPDASLEGGVQPSFWRYIFNFIYSFHMPLFIFLAGMVAYKIYDNVEDKKNRIISRFKRLMIPYFVWGVLYIPFRILLSRFSTSTFSANGIWKILLGENPYSGLWFLYALFCIDCIRTVIVTSKERENILLVVSLCLLLTNKITHILPEPLSWLANYTFYYMLGGLVKRQIFDNDGRIEQIFKPICLLIASICLIVINYCIPRSDELIFRAASIITAIIGIYFTTGVSCHVANFTVLEMLGNYSMEIYILSGPIIVVMRSILYAKFHINYNLYLAIAIPVAVFLPIILSKLIIERNKYIRLLLVGK